jgi:rubrerythrin
MVLQSKSDMNLFVNELCEYHIKLVGYSKQAHKELKHNIARIFEALSFSKQVQALCLLNYMGCVGNTKENLSVLIGDMETCNNMPAENSDMLEIIKCFDEMEEKNKHLYTCANDSSIVEKDLNIGNINVCSKCGNALVSDAPKECTVCHSPSGYFRVF